MFQKFYTLLVLPASILFIFSPPAASLSTRQSSCHSPSIRKEWSTVSQWERDAYTSAIMCLTKRSSKIGLATSFFDDFTWVHREVFGQVHLAGIEVVAQFLPWHRYFTHLYEKALQECGYRGVMTYWDWTLSAADPFNAPIFSDKGGIGGNGVQSQSCTYLSGQPQQCVATGPFAMLRPAYFDSRIEPHNLVRCFTCGVSATMYNDTWTAEVVNNVQKVTGYAKYGQELYMGPHLNIHEAIGGDFPQTTSPNEPLFFLHHTQVDRLWWKWQQADLKYRLYQYEGTNIDNSVNTPAKVSDTMHVLGLAMDVPVAEVMDTEGGILCYRYAN